MKLLQILSIGAVTPCLLASDLPTVDVFGDDADTPASRRQASSVAAEDEIPDWVNELSNLPAEARQKYMNHFAAAKWAYSQGSLDMCSACLDECDALYAKNPNVWNLRASVAIAHKQYASAEVWLKRVQTVAPDDLVLKLNYSVYYLGTSQYEACVREVDSLLQELEYKEGMEPLSHSLRFRKLVCLVLLDRVDEARESVKDITPLTFTPLYYYSQCVFAIVKKDRAAALQELTAANKIYSSDAYLQTYRQTLDISELAEKFTAPQLTK